ncbi:MAG: YceI family protein [Betaproteobacteria bacterium]|jgi:polyisoprenoid-binding protein YceI|nr:YceI family protein [Betaproteobacteria bacterium]HMV19881.1 YceI family protein [Rhodocyclaceae bacterium]HMW77012.1 YceI family protein [Rhodocyclaceae bacterium]HNE42140.1 YceI family protein [Rhodocyclaceae bacterium]HNL20554.1 YceI family protein [Rhodocyclaceae bacterium]
MARLVSLTTAFALFAPAAQAIEYGDFLADKSTLTFVSKQMGVPVDGRFRKFTAALSFDPAKPTAASARLELDLASIDAGSKDANDEVVGKAWFNLKTFPTASFVSTAVKPLGGDRYELAGKLTIKGKAQDIVAPMSFRQEGANGVFDGSFTLKRLDFAVGDGVWADVSTVANDVQVKFHLVSTPRK